MTFFKLRVTFINVSRRILGFLKWSIATERYVTHKIKNLEALLRKVIYVYIYNGLKTAVMQ